MPTIKEVARVAGVSVATVSHVLNDTRYVSPELSGKVRAAAAGLGYMPNGTARSLRLRKTQTIGLVVPDISPFFAELARVIEDHGFAAGYTTVLGNADGDADRERKYIETLLSKQVDGLILASALHDVPGVVRVVQRAATPAVLVDRDKGAAAVDAVLADNFGGGFAVTRHLLRLGHRRIACITGPPELRPTADRTAGYRAALADADIEPEPSWFADGHFHFEGGRFAMAALLDRGGRFTAVFATNDLMAIGALNEATRRGIRVPGDVSLAGFDDAFPAALVAPPLTTVRQPTAEMARAAVELLLSRMRGERDGPPERRVLPTELVVRQSTEIPTAEGW